MVNAADDRTWVPLELETDEEQRKRREGQAVDAARRQRVERAGLTSCFRCGGTTDEVDDESLRCVCAARDADRQARITRRLYERRTDLPDENPSDRIAP